MEFYTKSHSNSRTIDLTHNWHPKAVDSNKEFGLILTAHMLITDKELSWI